MKDKLKSKFFGRLVVNLMLMVFNVTLASAILMGIFIYIFSKIGFISINGRMGSVWTVIIMLLTSAILGVILAVCFGYKMVRPIIEISNATNKIAKGDFDVRIEEVYSKDDDIEVNQLIRNFNNMVNKLSKINTLRSDFVANVSHEFKTPLSTIQGYVTLLSDDSISKEERQKYIKIIYDATIRLTTLSSNILKISQLENEEVNLEIKEYNLSEQIREVIILQEQSWVKKNINLELDIDNVLISSDEELLKSVWMNLLSNAIKFSNDNSSIDISVKKDDNNVLVTIKDYGCGMDEETLEHIYEKFYQGDKSHSREGNGLGLSIVYKIIKLLNGKIDASSNIGIGTTFNIILPCKYMIINNKKK